jgi:4-hydroxybenzoate polyprenyltransferase
MPLVVESASPSPSSLRPAPARTLIRCWSYIRLDEVIVLQGTPILGALFSLGVWSAAQATELALFFAASFCLLAYVFTSNDWSGVDSDALDPNRSAWVSPRRSELLVLWMALLGLSLLLFRHFSASTFLLAVAIAGLSALYSFPRPHLKGRPLLSSALHLIGGHLHFLLGYSVFGPIDQRSLEIACFFGLMFAGGHLTHEARDHDADRQNGIWTNAVRFGRSSGFVASFALFTLANVWLVLLALRGIVPHILSLVAIPYVVYLGFWLQTLRAGLSYDTIRRLQVRYRILYAGVGLAMVISLIR